MSVSGECQERVRSVSGACQERVRRVSGECQDGACQERVRSVSGACQARVRSVSGACQEDTMNIYIYIERILCLCLHLFSLGRCWHFCLIDFSGQQF